MAGDAKKTVLTIFGPTAIGKTSLAIELAKELSGEVVSCDSRQLLKHLNIGTAKPTSEEMKTVRFHLVDVIEPARFLNAYEFRLLAEQAIDSIFDRGKLPVMTVGTGFYLKAMTDGIMEAPSADEALRAGFEDIASIAGVQALHEKLSKVDPETASALDVNDKVRIIRALELYELTGKTRNQLAADRQLEPSPYDFVFVGLTMDRQRLYDRIDARCAQMIEAGLIDECRRLRDEGTLHSEIGARVVGYREVLQYLDGVIDEEEMMLKFAQATRNYAKRQFTWFRKHPGGPYFDVEDKLLKSKVLEYFGRFL